MAVILTLDKVLKQKTSADMKRQNAPVCIIKLLTNITKTGFPIMTVIY